MHADEIAVDASRAGVAARTGTEWYSFELIRAMIAVEDRPPLRLYHRGAPPPELDGPAVSHQHIQQPRLWTHLGLSRAMRHDRPAALYVPSHVLPLVHPAVSVVTVHDLGYLAEPDAHPASTRRMLDLTTRWNARTAREIIAISGQTRDDLVRHYRVDPAKISVIHSGVDHQRFRPLDVDTVQAVISRLGINQPYLFFLSTVQPRKNVERLVEAFESLEPGLTLVIAGSSGWLSEPIEARIAGSSASDRIRRLGVVADADVPALYNGAEAFVLPSLFEGFGMGVLEAMACGCPVVTSSRSSLPEVAGGAAILIDPFDIRSIRDGIVAAIKPQRRAELVAAGIERARNFTWQQTATATLDVIRKAIDGRS
ncbi:MAG TPA: glycosyltransferase family 1 protein [Thermomicrobiales bacterium]|nr:glycosyltransferase family 1 protein [Thermomicrobiales bacterium]